MNTADRMVLNRLRDLIATIPNRAERFQILRAIKAYQSYRRVELFDEEEMLHLQMWLYELPSDDDLEQKRDLFGER